MAINRGHGVKPQALPLAEFLLYKGTSLWIVLGTNAKTPADSIGWMESDFISQGLECGRISRFAKWNLKREVLVA